MPDTTKYLPAVRLGRKAKGIPKNFSRAERQKRRERIIALNKKRKEKRMAEDTTTEGPAPTQPTPPTPPPPPPTT